MFKSHYEIKITGIIKISVIKGRQMDEQWHLLQKGSGCGSVGRAVASDTKGPWVESSHQKKLYQTFDNGKLYWKEEKEAGNIPIYKNNVFAKACADAKYLLFLTNI